MTYNLTSSRLCSRGCPPNNCSGASLPGPYEDRIHDGRSSARSNLMLSFVTLYGFVCPPVPPPLPPAPPPPVLLKAPNRLLLLLLLLLELGAPNGFGFAPGCSNLQFAANGSQDERVSQIVTEGNNQKKTPPPRRTSIATVPLLVKPAEGRHSECKCECECEYSMLLR